MPLPRAGAGGGGHCPHQFERTLQDLVKGLRDCKSDADTEAFISKALSEIKEEMASREIHLKAAALQKACYVREDACPHLETHLLANRVVAPLNLFGVGGWGRRPASPVLSSTPP